MSPWFSILNSTTSLAAIGAALLLTLGFLKLYFLTRTPVARIGMISCLINLGTWLIYGSLWVLGMLSAFVPLAVYRIYEIHYLWEVMWMITSVTGATSLACLAWTLHRGIRLPERPAP